MSVRKRSWITKQGETKEAWIVDYVDGQGERHIKTFARKSDATAHHAKVTIDVAKGVHTPENRSLTVATAAKQWLEAAALEGLERSTLNHYRTHVTRHIVPKIGAAKLATLTTPQVNAFRDALLRDLSRPLARKVLVSFRSVIKDARRRGTIAHNVAEGITIVADKRAKRRLEARRDIPTPDEVRRILAAAEAGLWRAILVTAAFTGLRASELRGLRWSDVDFTTGTVHVRQRADQWGTIGHPKTHTGKRAIPVGPFVVNTLREWKLACPKGEQGLVFPGRNDDPVTHKTMQYAGYWPAQRVAGVVDAKGKPKYPGLHAFRHFFASWCINRKTDGGLELPIKTVQQRLGHSTIVMTSDTYGHLFPRGDDTEELAAAERALLSPVS
jgi:integrase